MRFLIDNKALRLHHESCPKLPEETRPVSFSAAALLRYERAYQPCECLESEADRAAVEAAGASAG